MIQAWHDYFGMLGAAAATLLGLLFVSVSINAEVILGSAHKHAMRLAEQAFHNYIAAVVVSLVAFFPGISNESLGATILLLSTLYSIRLVIRLYLSLRATREGQSRIGAVRRYGSTLIGFTLLAIGGAQMALDNQLHTLVAVGSLMLLDLRYRHLLGIARARGGDEIWDGGEGALKTSRQNADQSSEPHFPKRSFLGVRLQHIRRYVPEFRHIRFAQKPHHACADIFIRENRIRVRIGVGPRPSDLAPMLPCNTRHQFFRFPDEHEIRRDLTFVA